MCVCSIVGVECAPKGRDMTEVHSSSSLTTWSVPLRGDSGRWSVSLRGSAARGESGPGPLGDSGAAAWSVSLRGPRGEMTIRGGVRRSANVVALTTLSPWGAKHDSYVATCVATDAATAETVRNIPDVAPSEFFRKSSDIISCVFRTTST